MSKYALFTVVFCLVAGLCFSQTTDTTANPTTPATDTTATTDPTTTIVVARMGIRTDAPHIGTYHYFEAFQLRGKWIYPDVGYIDYGHAGLYELFVGAGRTFVDNKKAMVASELYFVQDVGPNAKSARYLWPWTIAQVHLSPKWTSETVYFPYLPLNDSARIQHVLERAKIERSAGKKWKFGAGYAGYKYGNAQWQNKPMLTATVSTKAGSLETWLQKLPGGGQIQFRYTFVHTANKK